MPSEPRRASTSPVEVGAVGKTGFWLYIDDRELYLPFDWFPWFRNVTIDALTTIERPSSNHLYWPELDVDVAVAFIEYPTVNDREMPFSKAAHRVLALAGDEAQRLCHPYVGTEHLVLALTRQTQGTVGTALRTLAVNGERVRTTIGTTVTPGNATHGQRLSHTSRTKRVLVLAKHSAQAFGECEITAEHLLLGVLREASGVGAAVLLHHGLSEAAVLGEIMRIKGGDGTSDLP
ncbi:MAG: DUF2442 domain-containing protein [Gemmatimonadota bacterium]|nr:DUF2442 domain-containing protein [Gemmatimonadota bacterium]